MQQQKSNVIDFLPFSTKSYPKIERMLLYHLVVASEWQPFQTKAFYETGSLKTEGFIHLSTQAQVKDSLQRFFTDPSDVLVLSIDTNLLQATLKFERGGNSEAYPHLYGSLNMDAVVKIEKALAFLNGE